MSKSELGTLYFFPVEELELKAQGIEKQWFLTHQKGDCLISGHINKDNQWSLCNPQDLTPTDNYYEADKLWELLKDEHFVAGLNPHTEERNWNHSDESNHEDGPDSDSAFKLDPFLDQDVSLNVPLKPTSSFSLEENSSEEQEEVVPEEELEQGNQEWIIESPPPRVQLESEEQRQLLEQDLQTILWEGYKANLLNLEALEGDELWLMELDADLIKLTSAADQHMVFAIDKNGEIKNHLSLADANLLIDDSVLQEEGNRESGVRNQKEEEEQEALSREKLENTSPPLLEDDPLSSFELNKQEEQKPKGLEIE